MDNREQTRWEEVLQQSGLGMGRGATSNIRYISAYFDSTLRIPFHYDLSFKPHVSKPQRLLRKQIEMHARWTEKKSGRVRYVLRKSRKPCPRDKAADSVSFKKRYIARRVQDLCTECGGKRLDSPTTLCSRCRTRHNAEVARYTASHRNEQLFKDRRKIINARYYAKRKSRSNVVASCTRRHIVAGR
jgi:hypothetical protein